jgi:hypothetical protein
MVRIQRNLRAACPLVLALLAVASQESYGQHFLPDDPIAKVPEVAPVDKFKTQSINQLYDFAINSARYKTPPVTTSLGVNTVDEVPDSSWYTNRDLKAMNAEQLREGTRTHGAPQPPFTVVASKTEGVTPGFRMTDARGLLYFVKVDPLSNPEMASAADVVAPLFLYAAGYNVPENYILVARREDFQLSDKATVTELSGKKHSMSELHLKRILDKVPVTPDGKLRVMASLTLQGKIAGPFRYVGTRSDDPNDVVPHERRRDLRGLEVLFAWLNHTDAKGDNSMDIVVGKAEEARFRHNVLDFGDSFGSDSEIEKDPRHGQEYFLPATGEQLHRGYTLGLRPANWEVVRYPHDLPAIGNFTDQAFDPLTWVPNYPNPAFLAMTPEDGYWGAKKVMAFTNEDIAAIVQEAKFSDPQATAYMTKTLETRRDLVGRAWFAKVLPLEDFSIADGKIHFRDLGVAHGFTQPQSYRYEWFAFDNATQKETTIQMTEDGSVPPAANSSQYLGCRLLPAKQDGRATTVYFRKQEDGWKLVGVSRKTA